MADRINATEALKELARRELARRQPEASASILPFSKQNGQWGFDSDAGLLGAAKRAFTLPGEVYKGDVQVSGPDGRTSPEVIQRAAEAAAFATPVSAAARAGEMAIPGATKALQKRQPEIPTAEELLATGGKQHQMFRESGITYPVDEIAKFAQVSKQDLVNQGFVDKLAPKTHGVLNEVSSPPEGSIFTATNADALRQAFKNARKDFANPQEQRAAASVVDKLDDFLVGGNAQGSVAGTPANEIAKILIKGKSNYAAGKRAETLAKLQGAADLRAAVANSGQNVGNATRSRLASLLEKPKQSGGFTKAEKAMIEDVARGSGTANTMRAIGNVLGGGGGLGALATGGIGGASGAAMGGPIGAAIGATVPPVVGAAMKRGSANLTRKALEKVARETRKRSPLYEERLANAQMEAIPAERRAVLLRALLASNVSQ